MFCIVSVILAILYNITLHKDPDQNSSSTLRCVFTHPKTKQRQTTNKHLLIFKKGVFWRPETCVSCMPELVLN